MEGFKPSSPRTCRILCPRQTVRGHWRLGWEAACFELSPAAVDKAEGLRMETQSTKDDDGVKEQL